MSMDKTVEMRGLELRKGPNGWEYLSEGYGNEPDVWCPAADHLGPFGGNGVNALIDEVLALKAIKVAQEQANGALVSHNEDCKSRLHKALDLLGRIAKGSLAYLECTDKSSQTGMQISELLEYASNLKADLAPGGGYEPS